LRRSPHLAGAKVAFRIVCSTVLSHDGRDWRPLPALACGGASLFNSTSKRNRIRFSDKPGGNNKWPDYKR
jgi:hypothetical protein